jgi:hypothetical protein
MTEQDIRDLGFEQEFYCEETETGFADRYYYALEIVSGFSFISSADNELENGEWFAEIFNVEPAIRFTDADELRVLIDLLKCRISR